MRYTNPQGIIQKNPSGIRYSDEDSNLLASQRLGLSHLTLYDPNSRLVVPPTETDGKITVSITGGWSGTDPSSGVWWSFRLPMLNSFNFFSMGASFGQKSARLGYRLIIETLTTEDIVLSMGTTITAGGMAVTDNQILQGMRGGANCNGATLRATGTAWTSSFGVNDPALSGTTCGVDLTHTIHGSNGGFLAGNKKGFKFNSLYNIINDTTSAASAAGDVVVAFPGTNEIFGHLSLFVLTSGSPFTLTFVPAVYPVMISEQA